MTAVVQRLAALLGRDGPFARLTKNAATLIGGSALQSLLATVSIAISARALGNEQFGMLVLITSFAAITAQLVGFQSWQAVIRYVAEARAKGDSDLVGGLVKLGFILDVAGSIVATVVAVGGIFAGRVLLHLSPEVTVASLLFALTLLVNVVGTPTSILRLFDNYRAFALHGALSGIARVAIVTYAWVTGCGLLGFTIATAIAQVFASVLLLVLAAREARRNGLSGIWGFSARRTLREKPELRSFFLLTNLFGTARMIRELDIAVVGWIGGAASAGEFRIARQVASAINKIIDPFFHAIYPDLASMSARGYHKDALRLVGKSAALLGAIGAILLLVFVVVGQELMVMILGEAFRGAYLATAACIAAAVVWAFIHPVVPMLMVYERQRALLFILVPTSVSYLILVIFACSAAGALGASLAHLCFMLVYAFLVLILFRKAIRVRMSGQSTS